MKRKLLAFALIGILVSACSSDKSLDDYLADSTPSQNEGKGERGEPLYLWVNLSTPPQVVGRSSSDSRSYEEGSADENAVSSIRFYFFDDNDKIVNVRSGESLSGAFSSFFECDAPSTDDAAGSRGENVEKNISLRLCVGFENGVTPSKVVAVLNAPQSLTQDPDTKVDKQIEKLEDLQLLVKDFLTGYTNGNFLMSNSVYVDDSDPTNPLEIAATALSSNNFATAGSEPNPVDIYVERVVARVDLAFGSELKKVDGQENIFYIISTGSDTVTKIKPEDSGDEQTICVKILGWTVTSTPTVSRLLKTVEASWTDTDDFKLTGTSLTWNLASDFRSFWAINPSNLSQDKYKWWTFTDFTGKTLTETDQEIAEGCFTVTDNMKAYMQENANPFETGTVRAANATYPTKVIFGAQLVGTDGNPLEIAEYEGKYYTPSGLKSIIANSLTLYTESTDGTVTAGNTKYRKITGDEIDFETAHEHGNDFGPNADGTYYVYFKLKTDTDAEKNRKWFLLSSLNENTTEEMALTDEAIKQYFDNMTYPAKVWNKGYTYYYFDIPHFNRQGDDPGTYGVVRNNLYNATIREIKSLGTPVYKPDEVIYPEKPSSGGNQLEVTVKTMQWRLVNQNLQLAW